MDNKDNKCKYWDACYNDKCMLGSHPENHQFVVPNCKNYDTCTRDFCNFSHHPDVVQNRKVCKYDGQCGKFPHCWFRHEQKQVPPTSNEQKQLKPVCRFGQNSTIDLYIKLISKLN